MVCCCSIESFYSPISYCLAHSSNVAGVIYNFDASCNLLGSSSAIISVGPYEICSWHVDMLAGGHPFQLELVDAPIAYSSSVYSILEHTSLYDSLPQVHFNFNIARDLFNFAHFSYDKLTKTINIYIDLSSAFKVSFFYDIQAESIESNFDCPYADSIWRAVRLDVVLTKKQFSDEIIDALLESFKKTFHLSHLRDYKINTYTKGI
ncbi:MAG: hypothetical protein Q7S59_05875 [Sulfurimonas sp.]|nr:hypothetical protein [Sulfurimonas sp.]